MFVRTNIIIGEVRAQSKVSESGESDYETMHETGHTFTEVVELRPTEWCEPCERTRQVS